VLLVASSGLLVNVKFNRTISSAVASSRTVTLDIYS
jgi:hypothetical protein